MQKNDDVYSDSSTFDFSLYKSHYTNKCKKYAILAHFLRCSQLFRSTECNINGAINFFEPSETIFVRRDFQNLIAEIFKILLFHWFSIAEEVSNTLQKEGRR